jgi:NHL repeat
LRSNSAPSVLSTSILTRTLAAFGVIAALMLAASSGALAADQTYVNAGTFSSEGSGSGQLLQPRRLAVQNSTGHVFVVDRGNDRVQVFDPEGGSASFLTELGAATLDDPYGIAIDQTSGDVYVSDTGNERIVKFESDGAPTPTYTVDPGFDSPDLGAGAGQVGDFEADVAVDPLTGNLLVADAANDRISRYSAAGVHLSSFTGADSPDGVFTGLLDIDVAPNGTIYVVDSVGPVVEEGTPEGVPGPCMQNFFCNGEPSRLVAFNSGGVFQSTVLPLASTSVAMVAFDSSNGQLLVGRANPSIQTYATDGRPIDSLIRPEQPFGDFHGIAVGGTPSALYVAFDTRFMPNHNVTIGIVDIGAYAAIDLPEVAIDPATGATPNSVELSGSVDPNGSPTTYRFEYRRPGDAGWAVAGSGDAGSGTAPVPVDLELHGLGPNTAYEARLVAIGPELKAVFSQAVTFTTPTTPPFTHTRYAAPRTTTTARINGFVNPQNDSTTYYFEWGPTAAYGNTTPLGDAGSGGGQVVVAAELTGLQPNTTYHYRVIAENSAGPVEGTDRAFTTRTAAEMQSPQRGVELVNPPDKGNQNVTGMLTPNGDKVVWNSMAGAPGSSLGKGAISIAERTPNGWQSRSLLPAADQLLGGGNLGYLLLGASDDYSKTVYVVGDAMNPGFPDGERYFYSRYAPGGGSQQVLAEFPNGAFDFDYAGNWPQVSPDTEHVYMAVREDPEGGSPGQLFDFGSGSPRLVGILPETGNPPVCGVTMGSHEALASADGDRFYFLSKGDDCSQARQIYLYDSHGTADPGDDTTTRVSTPIEPGLNDESYPVKVSASGDSVLYVSRARITADDDNPFIDDQNPGADLYRWTIGEGSECITCIAPDPGLAMEFVGYAQNVTVSDDLENVYVSTVKQLVPGLGAASGQFGETNLYLFKDGEVRYISPGTTGQFHLRHASSMSADGSEFVFMSSSSGITSDDNGGVVQAYRYSQDDGSIECVSCPRDGQPAKPVSELRTKPFLLFAQPPANARAYPMTGDGQTFVFQTDTALLPADANNGPDIYEWHNGTLQLLTDGEGEYGGNISVPLSLEGISRDGLNVLFRVQARLTGHEADAVGQIYISRLGGGFPPPSQPVPCSEDGCQGPLEAPPPFTGAGSSAIQGAKAPSKAKPRKKPCRPQAKGKKAKKAKGKACAKKKKQSRKNGKRNATGRNGK